MKTIGSYLIILLLITAYGRCLADQMGALHDSETACCQIQPTCCDSDSHDEPSDPQENDQDNETPCHLCIILGNDSLLLQEIFEIPSLSPYYLNALWDDHFIKESKFNKTPQLDLSVISNQHAQSHSASQQRIVSEFHPVRGPSRLIS